MKRLLPIIFLGVAIALAAYATTYFCKTSEMRCLEQSKAPELAWLKTEFSLSDAEFERIAKLHQDYLPRCAEMCKGIGAKNVEIQALLAKTGKLTPEIEQKMSEAGALRVECQKHMLEHFIMVSQSMPKEQGGRYLEWVETTAFNSMQNMGSPKCPACRDEH